MNRLHTDGMSSMLAALLQQVMQLTPEQIAGLPQDQQAQVLALQQHMVRTIPLHISPVRPFTLALKGNNVHTQRNGKGAMQADVVSIPCREAKDCSEVPLVEGRALRGMRRDC